MLSKCSKYDILAIGDDEVNRTGNLKPKLIKVGPRKCKMYQAWCEFLRIYKGNP